MKLNLRISLLITLVLATQNEAKRNRDEKMFPLFNVVVFKNEFCSTQSEGSGGARRGTCYLASECSNKGGTSSGTCASGFGVCCLFQLTSGTVSENCTYLRNEGFPDSLTGTASTATFTIQKCSDDVCSVRLDFEQFTTLGPANTLEMSGGACTDMLTLSGSTGEVYPVICGQNDGQHVYVEMGANSGDTATLEFQFIGSGTRIFEIKASQIPCSGPSRPPEGCFQYYTGLQGVFRTFNFLDSAGQHLANQQYTACIRQEIGYCCAEYTVCNTPNSFTLNTRGAPATLNTRARIDERCNRGDWILINGASNQCDEFGGGATVASKLCGTVLNAANANDNKSADTAVCDCIEPFELGIRTDTRIDQAGGTENAAQSRGICLNWRLLPCVR